MLIRVLDNVIVIVPDKVISVKVTAIITDRVSVRILYKVFIKFKRLLNTRVFNNIVI